MLCVRVVVMELMEELLELMEGLMELMWRHSCVNGRTGHIRSGDTVVSVVVQVTGGVDIL